MSHPQYTGRKRRNPKLTPDQAKYVDSHYQTMTVSQMAANRHIPSRSIYEYMSEKALPTLDSHKRKREPDKEFFRWEDFEKIF